MGIEVIAIEDSDAVGIVEDLTTIGEVNFNSMQSFVDNVLASLAGRKMSLLHIQVHGNETTAYFGNDELSNDTYLTHPGNLSRLTRHFDSPGFFTGGPYVDFRACQIGNSLDLLRRLAALWQVTVVAGRGFQNNVLDFNTGRYVMVRPDGTSETFVTCPPPVRYDATRRLIRHLIN
jgi:hypothetical protein